MLIIEPTPLTDLILLPEQMVTLPLYDMKYSDFCHLVTAIPLFGRWLITLSSICSLPDIFRPLTFQVHILNIKGCDLQPVVYFSLRSRKYPWRVAHFPHAALELQRRLLIGMLSKLWYVNCDIFIWGSDIVYFKI